MTSQTPPSQPSNSVQHGHGTLHTNSILYISFLVHLSLFLKVRHGSLTSCTQNLSCLILIFCLFLLKPGSTSVATRKYGVVGFRIIWLGVFKLFSWIYCTCSLEALHFCLLASGNASYRTMAYQAHRPVSQVMSRHLTSPCPQTQPVQLPTLLPCHNVSIQVLPYICMP